MMEIALESGKFSVIYHGGDNGKMRRGYHCPDCKKFYAEGNFTIESGTMILGRKMYICCCSKVELPVPYLFEEAYQVRQFVNSVNMNIEGLRATLINKERMCAALFNPSAIAKYKQKNFH